MNSVVQNLRLDQIRTDGGTQPRAHLNEATVAEYAESITDGVKLPPIVVFHDGASYWLADGFHRFHAHRKIDAIDISAEVRQGTRRDAILYSVGANAVHGLRRTNDDKKLAVLTLLGDEEWAKWSNNQIAKACGVSLDLVNRTRNSLKESLSDDKSQPRTYTTKHGTQAVMKTANIGKPKDQSPKKPVATVDPEPANTSDDEVAEAHNTIIELAEENERLKDRLSVAVLDASEEEKAQAADTISDLRQQVRALEQELDAVKASRDTYMQKVAEMQRQINYWRKQAEKGVAA